MRSVATGALKVGSPAVLVDALDGQVRYDWAVGDTDTIGLFIAYWTVTFQNGTVLDYPSDVADTIEIVTGPNLGYTLKGACKPWTTVQSVRACCGGTSAITGTTGYVTDQVVQQAVDVATDLLYVLSGQQFPGECLSTVRPCKEDNCYGSGMWVGNSWAGNSTFPTPGDPSGFDPPECGCGRLPKVDLGLWPVTNILSVKIDGAVVDPATYRLDEYRYLVRLAPDANSPNPGWPSCQRLDLPSTSVDTWEVTVEHGVGPPPAGENAAARLACEIVKSCIGADCRLPNRVQSVNRQQVSLTMIDPSMLDKGRTGVYEVDLFLATYNPSGTRGITLVYSPDLPKAAWRAGT